MSKRNALASLLYVSIYSITCIAFVGCIPYHKIIKGEFPQGEDKKINYNVVEENLKNARIYNGFSSELEINALWFSDNLRTLYTDIVADKKGKSINFKKAMLRRQLEENKHSITFYILVYTPRLEHSALNEKDPFWSLHLEFENGKKIFPESIKEVDLTPEIKALFGEKYSDFKRSFKVIFPLKEHQLEETFGSSSWMKMIVSSIRKNIKLIWLATKEKSNLREIPSRLSQKSGYEDFYWM